MYINNFGMHIILTALQTCTFYFVNRNSVFNRYAGFRQTLENLEKQSTSKKIRETQGKIFFLLLLRETQGNSGNFFQDSD